MTKRIVTVSAHEEGLRLRWRYQKVRYQIYLSSSKPDYQILAEQIRNQIEEDILSTTFDTTRKKYQNMVPSVTQVTGYPYTQWFTDYLESKSLNVSDDNIPSYYRGAKRLLIKWQYEPLDKLPGKLAEENFSNRTFNDRRNCLVPFFNYLVQKKRIPENPLINVNNRKKEKYIPNRVPFTDVEVKLILNALKTDQFKKKGAQYSHVKYYPFVAFMLETGVRNAEAIGLQVRDILWDDKSVRICRSLARTSKGTHANARVEKGTKMENVRFIPLNDFLIDLLKPLCKDKLPTDTVFTGYRTKSIDDHAFQRRVFKPILKHLGIPNRDIYAFRHTFATRMVQLGIKPHQVAYLMGDSLETIINNYFHPERENLQLPSLNHRLGLTG